MNNEFQPWDLALHTHLPGCSALLGLFLCLLELPSYLYFIFLLKPLARKLLSLIPKVLQYPALERKRAGPGLMALTLSFGRQRGRPRTVSFLTSDGNSGRGRTWVWVFGVADWEAELWMVKQRSPSATQWPARCERQDVRNILLRMPRLTDRKIIFSKAHKFSGMKKCWKWLREF